MDISLLSFIDLIRNISLAVFAVSTWYITHEEKRTRILLNLSMTVENRPILNLAETMIELRDKKGIKKTLGEQIKPRDLERLERKMDKLRKLDYARTSSIIAFSLLVTIEVTIFACHLLTSFLN